MKIIRNIAAGFGTGLSVLAVASLSVLAQVAPSTTTNPRQPVARYFPTQQTAYVRTTFAFNSCTQVSNVCTVKYQNASLPYNAAILRVTAIIYTAFNSTTTDTVTIGTTAANANELVTACNIHALAAPVACTLATGINTAIGNSTAQSGTNGNFDLYMKWTGGGGTPNAGLASFIIEYAMPNDGLCTVVSANQTAVGC